MSQYADILNHCRGGNAITSMVAMQRYGCCRLSERVRELERQGHKFNRAIITIINRHGRKITFTAYSLIETA